jgi:hypothetical protein
VKSSRAVAVAVSLLALSLAAMALLGRSLDAAGSVLAKGSGGWLAARRYLEAQGCHVRILDSPLREAAEQGVLVVSFPWQRLDPLERMDSPPSRVRADLQGHLRKGGSLILAFSGKPGPVERETFEAMGFPWREVRGQSPLGPFKWWTYAREEWALVPIADVGAERQQVTIGAPRSVPRMPAAAQELYRGPQDVPLVFVAPMLAGRVIVLPTEVLSNARFGQPGSADLLESLRVNLGEPWAFDEYHHGLQAPPPPGARRHQHVLDLWLAHLALLYVLAVLALSRRFGPVWRESPPITGSTGAFLVGLGALHRRLGHHREAALALVSRAAELNPWLSIPALARRRAQEADAEGFLSLARELSQAEARGRRHA